MGNLQVFWWMVLWGLIVLASWVGWGTLIAKAVGLRRGSPIDWGLRAAWGMAFTLAIGGFLMLFRLATAPAVQILVLVGAAVFGGAVYSDLRRPKSKKVPALARKRPTPWLWHLPVLIVVAVTFLGSVESTHMNWWDDCPAYLPFIRKMFATGTILEPFSWRRLSTYGGHLFLQAQVLSAGPDFSAFMVDQGLSLVVFWGLLVGLFARTKRHLWMLLIVGLLAVWVDIPRVNSQSELSGAVLFLAMYRTLRLQRLGDPQSKHVPWILGLLASGATTLRMNFLPVAGLILVLVFAGAAAIDRRRWKTYALRTAISIGIMLVLLVPWAIVLYQSSGSLFYPVMPGNQRPEFAGLTSAPWSFLQKLQWTAGFLVNWQVLLLAAPLLLALRRRHWRDILPMYVAGIVGAAAVAWSFTSSDYWNLYRYSFPFLFPSALIALALALQHWRFRRLAIAGGILSAALLATNVGPGIKNRLADLEMTRESLSGAVAMASESNYNDYRAAQEIIPKGARVLSYLPQPTLLDYERNDILIADYPSVACPDPGMPLSQGPEAFRLYLESQGIQYIMAPDFEVAPGLYNRPFYAAVRDHPESFAKVARPDAVIAPAYLAALELVDALARTPRLLNPARSIRVIQINP